MFNLTLLDHLRLTFGHVVSRHRAHSHIAHTRAQASRRLRPVEALLLAIVAFTAIGTAFGQARGYAIAAAVSAGVAMVVFVVHLTADLDRTAQLHGACASRLWLIRERYRALMSDLADEAIDLDAARRRRDALMTELHAIYENAPPGDHQAYQNASEAVKTIDEAALADEEIDLFLPKSLQKAERAAGSGSI